MAALTGPRKWAYRAFRAVPAPVRGLGEQALRVRAERAVRAQPDFAATPVRLLLGPTNTAGQAWQWARAAERLLPGVSALNVAAEGRTGSSGLGFPHDVALTQAMQLRGLAAHRQRALRATHAVSESARPLLGSFFTGTVLDDLPELEREGVATAVLLHGSEVRDLAAHAERYPHSPFAGPRDDYLDRLDARVRRTVALLRRFPGPVLVSTPDLLDFVPGATWLPLVVDVGALATDAPVLRRRRPVVLHAPSNPRLKGTEAVEAALSALAARGLVDYRRLQGVPHARMAQVVADADVVVDQVVLGNPGVLLAETLAAGRLAVAHLADQVRERMAGADPAGRPVPVVEAAPGTVGSVIERVLAERDAYRELAGQGPAWARRNHDGRRAASALRPFLLPG